jgi:hypothetical protein
VHAREGHEFLPYEGICLSDSGRVSNRAHVRFVG